MGGGLTVPTFVLSQWDKLADYGVLCPSQGLGWSSWQKAPFAVKAVGDPSDPPPSWAGHSPAAAGSEAANSLQLPPSQSCSGG